MSLGGVPMMRLHYTEAPQDGKRYRQLLIHRRCRYLWSLSRKLVATTTAEPRRPTHGRLQKTAWQLTAVRGVPQEDRRTSHLWNEYIQRYHYLGYQPLPGAQMRYLATAQGRVLALLGFGAAAWKIAPRGLWIGWSAAQRRERLHLIINNARFLILPWITCRNLASKLLAMAARRIQDDWAIRYGYRPVLLETFVESQRFTGTCYRAANWTHVGQTQGRGKLDTNHQTPLAVKDIWLFPLEKRFKTSLCS